MVDSLCAITIVVLSSEESFISASSASCTILSLSLSKALVASSRSKTFGRLRSARAMQMRCFCPPEIKRDEPAPTSVSYPSGNSVMKEWAFANFAA
mmetsp:Transcript_2806/g.5972  ORF Transcript_2806/g.5972 Transcript_2806/m.5972 type:complete len:96 (-) Transcript_2806:1123-1410(-)